jgi:hypothetical protein
MWYDAETSLPGLLELVIQNYETDRKAYWSENQQDANVLDIVEALAKSLRAASDELQASPAVIADLDFDWEQVRLLSRLPEFQAHLLDQLEIDVAYEFASGTREVARRCYELTREVLSTRPGDRVLRFLRRLSRCYIAGLLPECVIISRALLENAVIERFERGGIPIPATAEGRSPMRTRIEAARKFGWLSDGGASDAMVVWERGNTAVHYDPEAVHDVLGTVRLTMRVLHELYA